jgi:hypothetical protein
MESLVRNYKNKIYSYELNQKMVNIVSLGDKGGYRPGLVGSTRPDHGQNPRFQSFVKFFWHPLETTFTYIILIYHFILATLDSFEVCFRPPRK